MNLAQAVGKQPGECSLTDTYQRSHKRQRVAGLTLISVIDSPLTGLRGSQSTSANEHVRTS
jgi:hypothetical protein